MKLLKAHKILTIASMFCVSTSLYAATDWNLLIEEMPLMKIETVKVDPKGYVTMDVAKRPNGKLRFMGFRSYLNPTKMILNINSKTNDIEKLCNNYLNLKKSFKAELIFNVSPISENFNFKLGEESYSTSDFENPFTLGVAIVENLPNTTEIPYTFNSSDYLKFKNYNANLGIPALLNNAIKNRTSDTVVVDLSNYNGVACDMALGNVRPVINKTISFERALPPKALNWINKDHFTEIYKNFWLDHDKIEGTDLEQKSSELILLGMKVANLDTVKKNIFETSSRPMKLLSAIKFNKSVLTNNDVRTINPEEQWQRTFDYLIPESTKVNSSVLIQREAVFVSITE